MQFIVAALALLATTPLLAQSGPTVDIWLDNGGLVRRGDVVNVHYTGEPGSYVAVVRFDADGWMTMLVPSSPNDQTKLSAATDRLATFTADADPGVGTVFAIASRTPLDFSSYRERDGRWRSASGQTGRVDLSSAISRVARQMAGSNRFTLASVEYRVGNQTTQAAVVAPYESQGVYYDTYGYGTDLYDSRYDPFGYGYSYGLNGLPYYQPLYGHRLFYGSRPRTQPRSPSGMTNLHRCPDGTLVPPSVHCLPLRGQSWPSRPGRPSQPHRLHPPPPHHFTPTPSVPRVRPSAPRQYPHPHPVGPPPVRHGPASPPNGHHGHR